MHATKRTIHPGMAPSSSSCAEVVDLPDLPGDGRGSSKALEDRNWVRHTYNNTYNKWREASLQKQC